MSVDEISDQTIHEAIGWLASVVGGPRLAEEARRAASADCPGIAKKFLRLADMMAESHSAEWDDRRREHKDTVGLLIDLEDAEYEDI